MMALAGLSIPSVVYLIPTSFAVRPFTVQNLDIVRAEHYQHRNHRLGLCVIRCNCSHKVREKNTVAGKTHALHFVLLYISRDVKL